MYAARFLSIAVLTLLVAVLAGCGSTTDSTPPAEAQPAAIGNTEPDSDTVTLKSVDLVLNWFPEAEHGGYYAALVHGYYEEAGLAVEIVAGGPGVKASRQVATGARMFGCDNADKVLMAASQEALTVALLAPMQNSPRCIMVHKDSGIRKFEDLKDMTIALGTTSSFALYMQKRLPLTNVRVVPYKGALARFLNEKDFAQQAYVFSEPFLAQKQGAEPFNLMASGFGFNPYTSVLVTNPDTLRDDPETVFKFVQASKKGWQKYLEDPVETNKYINQQNTEMGMDILAFGAKELKELCITDDVPAEQLGAMKTERWEVLAKQLVEVEAIKADSVDIKTLVDTQFLTTETTAPAAE
ncbi:MAG: myristoyl transferase [Planctomycetaceae bacterium]|nr:myristoyl transferase [Planctomycetaceae bacterium]